MKAPGAIRQAQRAPSAVWRRLIIAIALIAVLPGISAPYSVLTHEAIIDAMWERDISPLLLRRFPRSTPEQLRVAHGYAYGGSIIQDMGYYPFGSRTYTDLTHYVRSGDFIEALLRDATNINEYAFAIGALSHYWADYGGHTIATNASVAILYPKLHQRFGNAVTYEQNPKAHIQTEFGFDVLQVAQGHYAAKAYHDFIGFFVAKELLERAFRDTYGVELRSLFADFDLAVNTYRHSVGTLIPRLTKMAWEATKSDMREQGVVDGATLTHDSAVVSAPKGEPTNTREQFLYTLSRADYAREWGEQYEKPGVFSRLLSWFLSVLHKIGLFKQSDITPSTRETEQLFMRGFNVTVEAFRKSLRQVRAGTLDLPNMNFDTGKPTAIHEYRLADRAYARLLHALVTDSTPAHAALRANVLAFYRDTSMRAGTRADSALWKRTMLDLRALKARAGK